MTAIAVFIFAVLLTAALVLLGLRVRPPVALCLAAAVLVSGCGGEPGMRIREVERFSEMSDEEIDKVKRECYVIATTDYNCSNLIPPEQGMDTNEWRELSEKTKICRQNQDRSFNQCLRGRGVRYSEFH